MSLKSRLIVWILKGVPKDGVRRALFIAKLKPKVDEFFEEGKMEAQLKSKWKSKTVWTAIIAALLGAVQPVSTALGQPIEVPMWVYEVLAGFGLYALRDGQNRPIK